MEWIFLSLFSSFFKLKFLTRDFQFKNERGKKHDHDQRAKYGMASVSSFNHGWRNYRFIFSIIFIFAISPFAPLHASPSLRSTALSVSPPSLLCQSTRTHYITFLPRVMSLIFSSLPSCVSSFFSSSGSSWSRFTSFFTRYLSFLPAPPLRFFFLLLYPRRPPRLIRLPILLPRTPCLIVVLFFCYHTRAIREYEGRRGSRLNVPHRNWKRTW